MPSSNCSANHDRIVFVGQSQMLDCGEANDLKSFTLYAPRGYRVVSGGYNFNSLESGLLLASYPQYNAHSSGTGLVGGSRPDNQEGWTWEWKIIDPNGTATFTMICERDDGLTLEVSPVNVCPIGL